MSDLIKISKKDMCTVRNHFSFYDFSEQSSIENSNIVVEFNSEKVVTYSELHLGKSKKTCSLYRSLKKNRIKNKFGGGIQLSCNDKLLFSFLDSNLKYNSFFNILLPDSRIVITPTDHMDIFFDAENVEEVKADLKKLLYKNNFFNIRFL